MAITYPQQRDHLPSCTIKITLSAETSQPIYIPAGTVGLEVVPLTGTVRFEQTSATEEDVAAGTAYWFPWANGDVSVPTSSAVLCATAVRCIATGVATFYVCW